MEKVLENLQKYILYMVLGFFAVFILSSYPSPYIIPKEILLVTGICLLILTWVAKVITKGTLSFSVGRFDLGVLFIGLAYFISTFFATPNKMEAYLLPGTTTFVLCGTLLYFLVNQVNRKVKEGVTIALFMSGVLLALTSLVSSLNAFDKIPQLPAFIKDTSFNPMGGVIPSIVFLSVVLVFSVSIFIKEKDVLKKFFYGASMAVVLFALVTLVNTTLPSKTTAPRMLSMQNSWEVAVESLKKRPFLGVGPANYLTAFDLFRPVTYNQSDLWQIRFTGASNFYFTLVTEVGFLGLFAITVLMVALYRYIESDLKHSLEREYLAQTFEKLSLVVNLILFAVLPIAPSLMVLLFVLLAIVSKSEHKTVQLNVIGTDSNSLSSRVPAFIVGLPFIAVVIAILFFGSKVLAGERTFAKSLDALSKNDAKSTYDLMNSAINQNPKVDRYHASFAQVNIALASSIANKKDISESDRSNISQLIQQAIAEGKSTVALNPQRSGNWEVLAQIYRNIMPFANGADQFAIQTYTQAIVLDPTNPNLRIALGGVYYSLGNFDLALDSFKLAVLAKPDLPNAHYNLAVVYREKKDFPTAITEINTVLKLIAKDSKDYTLAKQTLTDLENKNSAAKAAIQPSSSENLTEPLPKETSNIKPPIELPKEATPPAATK